MQLQQREKAPMKAIWNNTVIADSDDTVMVEGNHYFPEQSVNKALLQFSNHKTSCAWKGQASYYSLLVNGDMNVDAAWFYPDPKPEAESIRNRVAFWKGVKVTGLRQLRAQVADFIGLGVKTCPYKRLICWV